jgi:hypothetical protein
METRQTPNEGTAADTFMGNNTNFFSSSGNVSLEILRNVPDFNYLPESPRYPSASCS